MKSRTMGKAEGNTGNEQAVQFRPFPATIYHHLIIITMENVLFTESQFAGTRVYHFDAREDVNGDPYLQIVEAPTGGGNGKRHRIFIHAQDLATFKEKVCKVIDRCIEQFESNVNKS